MRRWFEYPVMPVNVRPGATTDAFLDEMLGHLRPDTEDATYLDHISAEQLTDFTYRVGERFRDASDGNALVPEDVADSQQEGSNWDYPSSHSYTFLIDENDLEDTTLDLTVGGFQAAQVKADSSVRGNLYSNFPENLFTVTVGDEDIDLAGEYRPRATAAPPVYFTFEDTIELDELDDYPRPFTVEAEETTIQRWTADDNRVISTDIDRDGSPDTPFGSANHGDADIEYERHELAGQIDVDLRASREYDGYHRLTVRYSNITPTSEDASAATRKARFIYYPFTHIEFDGAEPPFPQQQHVDALQSALGDDEDSTGEPVVEGLPHDTVERLYTQRDCILTQEPDDPDSFFSTSFGVFDYVRQRHRNAGRVSISDLIAEDTDLPGRMDKLSDAEQDRLRDHDTLLYHLKVVLAAVNEWLGDNGDELYPFQWAAIQERVRLLLDDRDDNLVVQAPTSAGKTLVYFASSALVVLERDTRAVLPFPTRILNEDMMERVIDFTYALREFADSSRDLDCGICIGQQEVEWSYQREYLEAQDMLDYIPRCHSCGSDSIEVKSGDHYEHPHCASCGYDYDWVYDVKRTTQYLPSFAVGTPERIFYMPTLQTHTDHSTYSTLPFFGAPYTECRECGRALTDMNTWRVRNDRNRIYCAECGVSTQVDWRVAETDRPGANHSPVGHIVLDETHMYTGHFGIGMSIMMEFFEVLASRLRETETTDRHQHSISADAGTATISNKLEHIRKLLRAEEDEVVAIPEEDNHGEYFEPMEDRVRYRVLGIKPVASSNRESFRQSIVRTYDDIHNPADQTYRRDLEQEIDRTPVPADPSDYELILGYLYRKSEGRALQNSIRDLADDISDGRLDPPFLSGDSSKEAMRRHIGMGEFDAEPVVLANLVISLGIDIPELNNLILYGAPRSMSEQMQTIGRTGRDAAAGHATIHLFPTNPRDLHIHEQFHTLLSDITDYYERAAIQPTNPYLADELFDCILGPFLTIELAIEEEPHDIGSLADIMEYTDEPRSNPHITRVLDDLLTIFVPDSIDLDENLQHEIEDNVTERLMTYIGYETQEGIWRRQAYDDADQNVNTWLRNRADGLNLRGSDAGHVSERIEWGTETLTGGDQA